MEGYSTMRKYQVLFFLVLVLPLLAARVGCGGSTTTPTGTTATTTPGGTPQSGGTLHIIWSTGPGPGWGTPVAIFGGEGAYGDPAMESLMEAEFMGGYEMRLGTGYQGSADAKSIT